MAKVCAASVPTYGKFIAMEIDGGQTLRQDFDDEPKGTKPMKTIFQIFAALVLCVSTQAGLNDGLVAYYPFNGNANDASGNANNGIVYGATSTTNRFGTPNAAYDFNSSSYIDIPQNSTLNSLTDFTLSAWIYQRGANAEFSYRILDKCPAGVPGGWTFDTWDGTTGRRLRLQAAGASNPNVPGTTVYSLMQWHHVVATVSGTTGKVYLDGNLDGVGNVGNIPQNTLDVFIGRAHVGCGGGCGIEEFFNGQIGDVRIYNRALSASEIQQLYSLPNIGLAPTNPVVVQTNRTPTSTELGVQTNGSFKIFTNGAFVSGVALDPSKKTVVLTHGWNDSPTNWPWEMAETLQFELGSSALNIVAWDWSADAQSVLPWTTAANTPREGKALGTNLLFALGINYSKPIHFIGHSFGTLVNAGAADYLLANGYSWTNIQMTLFDEAEVGSGSTSNTFQTTAATITSVLADDSSSQPFWYHPLPTNCAWADNYITAFGMLHTNAANIILTNDFPIATILPSAAFNEIAVFHGYPATWYDDSIANPAGSTLGFAKTFEENGLPPPPAINTYFIEAFTSSDLDLSPSDFTSASQLLNARLKNMLNPIYYNVVQAAPAPLQAAGQITAGIQDTLSKDPYAFATGLPESWGINVNLATSSSSGSSPAPQIKVHPLGLTANDTGSSANTPAFVWIPLAVPSNAVSMSFDFSLQGDCASDSFVAALNGTNLFSLDLSLTQTNVLMNSGQIDVSQYAATNAELFLGIVGGTSTNANVSVSGLRFYSMAAPLLQAQTAGNNPILTWPLSASGFNLQTTTNIADPNSWTTVTSVSTIVNLQNTVTNSNSGSAQFYRLKK